MTPSHNLKKQNWYDTDILFHDFEYKFAQGLGSQIFTIKVFYALHWKSRCTWQISSIYKMLDHRLSSFKK